MDIVCHMCMAAVQTDSSLAHPCWLHILGSESVRGWHHAQLPGEAIPAFRWPFLQQFSQRCFCAISAIWLVPVKSLPIQKVGNQMFIMNRAFEMFVAILREE